MVDSCGPIQLEHPHPTFREYETEKESARCPHLQQRQGRFKEASFIHKSVGTSTTHHTAATTSPTSYDKKAKAICVGHCILWSTGMRVGWTRSLCSWSRLLILMLMTARLCQQDKISLRGCFFSADESYSFEQSKQSCFGLVRFQGEHCAWLGGVYERMRLTMWSRGFLSCISREILAASIHSALVAWGGRGDDRTVVYG